MSELRDHDSALPAQLVARALSGSRRAIAQVVSLVENDGRAAQEVMSSLYPRTGRAQVIGITGSPGTGKSTLVSAMAKAYRGRGFTVGVVAVDPTSPFSGGAILGDRIRMRDLSGDPGVFIRSMATRGALGGLAATTSDVVRVLDAVGYQVILIETVGVGQAEVDVVRVAHTVLVVEAPGLGDDIQTLKAGIIEIADIFVVNKADLPGTDAVVSALRAAISLGRGALTYAGHHQLELPARSNLADSGVPDDSWQIPVHEVAALDHVGIDALVETIDAHAAYLHRSGRWQQREKERIESDLTSRLRQLVIQRLMAQLKAGEWEALLESIVVRDLDPQTAAARLMERLMNA